MLVRASVPRVWDQQWAALGVPVQTDGFYDVPENVEQFRKIADGLDLTTEEGGNFYPQLTQLAPALSQVTQVIQQ